MHKVIIPSKKEISLVAPDQGKVNIVQEIWENSSDDDFKEELEREIKESKEREQQEIEEEQQQLEGFDSIQDIIKGMCEDMQKENPNIHNQLGGLIKKLEEQSNIVTKGIKGGGRKKLVGKRLSSLTDEEVKQYPSKQGKYTKNEIAEKLKNFTKISKKEFFEFSKKGIWIRYFTLKDGLRLFRTGGFIINIDEDKRYVTLVAHHANNSPTWNMQLETTHSIYVHTKNIKTFRLKQMDKKYNMSEGTANLLNKWFVLDFNLLTKMQIDNKNFIYVIYDKANHKLYAPVRRQTNKKLLEALGIEEKTFQRQLIKGLKKQLENPIDGIYIVNVIEKADLPKVKKMKSRIKTT